MRLNHFLILLLATVSLSLLAATGDRPAAPASPETKADLSAALSHRLQAALGTQSLTFDLFTPELDTAFISPDGNTAVMWLALREDSGRLLAAEPGLVLARHSDTGWQVLLPGDPGWEEALAALPAGMLPLEHSPAPNNSAPAAPTVTEALTGYYLPYAAGTSRRLEGSISHFQSIPELGYPSCTIDDCQYAYDFTDAWHFPLLASKDGTVYATRDSCTDGGTNCTNYVVLRDTSGQTYQIYLHLAHGTIPDKLTAGKAVRRGEYIGDSDDTGYSTSEHVHFMVTDSIWIGGDGYYWGQSVNVHFADVAINNGVPRTCYEVTHFAIYDGATQCLGSRSDPLNPSNNWYVSGNVGAYPPTGSYTRPTAGATVAIGSNPLMDVTAKVSDDVGVTAVRMVAKLSGQWVEIGPKVTQPAQPGVYDWDVDLCAVGPLNGPLEVALRAWDYEGNVASAIGSLTVQVDHACPPPISQLKPAESFDSTAVRLSWDVISPGIGLGSFELQWRTEPGVWDAANILTFPVSQQSTWFVGQPGGSYAFRLRATDTNNQSEPWPANDAAETSVTLPATCTQDAFEPDDDLTQARALVSGEWAQRNLCGSGNPDWFRVEIGNASGYFVNVLSQNGGAAVSITVYAEDGTTILASSEAAGLGQGAEAFFRTAAAGIFYIKIEPLVANLQGTDAVYSINGAEAKDIFVPLVLRP
jgi:murein DD-endopeptidase MepM/ murein hydrolase activator NlpD